MLDSREIRVHVRFNVHIDFFSRHGVADTPNSTRSTSLNFQADHDKLIMPSQWNRETWINGRVQQRIYVGMVDLLSEYRCSLPIWLVARGYSRIPVHLVQFIMSSMSGSPSSLPPPSDGAKSLQERLNLLLSKLSSAIETVKTWPTMDGDDASIHVKTTSKLIVSIQEIVTALKNVEGTLKSDAELRNSLKNCPVPINLLDLLDHGNGLNPGT